MINSYFLYWNFDWKSCFVVFFLEWNEWKNPQFNFLSQNLSIERNFFKWDGKETKLLHLLFHRIWKKSYLDLLCPSCNMILISIFYSFFPSVDHWLPGLVLHYIFRFCYWMYLDFFSKQTTTKMLCVDCSHSESKFGNFWKKNWVLWHAHRGKTNIFGDFCSTVYIPTLLWMHINSCLTCLWEICGKPSRKCTFYTTNKKMLWRSLEGWSKKKTQ